MTAPLLTTYPTVRQELVTRIPAWLQDLEDATAIAVTYGDPGRHTPDRYVAVSSTTGDVEHAIKRLPHDSSSSVDEDYSLELVIWRLVRSRNDPEAQRVAVEDVAAIAQAIDAGLRANQEAWTLGGLVTWCYVSGLTPDDFTLSEGRASQIVLTLTVKAARI